MTTAMTTALTEPTTGETGNILTVANFAGGFRTGAGFKPVLQDVSFALGEGKMTAIVGETGSGKTIMALSMMGLAASSFVKTGGSIEYAGDDISTYDDRAYRPIRGGELAMVFQDARAALNPVLSVGKQLIDACRAHQSVSVAEAREIAAEMLRKVRVPEPAQRMKQFPHEFSGGMSQRVMLALALICQPKVVILDEPTTGLDVTIQADIMELIVDLVRSGGTTACLITHDLGVVAETCDDVVVMLSGEVKETGTVAEVLAQPKDDYTKRLLRASRFEEMSA
jgi:ABC-type glutathione transport system ATPase component